MAEGGESVVEWAGLGPVNTEVASVVVSDGMELALQKGLKFVIVSGSKALEETGATKWQRAKAGAKIVFGPKVAYANLKEALKPDIGLLVTAASTLGKAASAAYFGGKAEAARDRYLEAACELETSYQVYYVSLGCGSRSGTGKLSPPARGRSGISMPATAGEGGCQPTGDQLRRDPRYRPTIFDFPQQTSVRDAGRRRRRHEARRSPGQQRSLEWLHCGQGSVL